MTVVLDTRIGSDLFYSNNLVVESLPSSPMSLPVSPAGSIENQENTTLPKRASSPQPEEEEGEEQELHPKVLCLCDEKPCPRCNTKQRLTARQRKRQLERSFGSDHKPGTLRHRLNYLENKFGDQLASLEDSLPKTFYRTLSLETLQKLEARNNEQQVENSKTNKRWRVHKERTPTKFPSDRRLSDSVVDDTQRSRKKSDTEAEVTTFRPKEVPDFHASAPILFSSSPFRVDMTGGISEMEAVVAEPQSPFDDISEMEAVVAEPQSPLGDTSEMEAVVAEPQPPVLEPPKVQEETMDVEESQEEPMEIDTPVVNKAYEETLAKRQRALQALRGLSLLDSIPDEAQQVAADQGVIDLVEMKPDVVVDPSEAEASIEVIPTSEVAAAAPEAEAEPVPALVDTNMETENDEPVVSQESEMDTAEAKVASPQTPEPVVSQAPESESVPALDDTKMETENDEPVVSQAPEPEKDTAEAKVASPQTPEPVVSQTPEAESAPALADTKMETENDEPVVSQAPESEMDTAEVKVASPQTPEPVVSQAPDSETDTAEAKMASPQTPEESSEPAPEKQETKTQVEQTAAPVAAPVSTSESPTSKQKRKSDTKTSSRNDHGVVSDEPTPITVKKAKKSSKAADAKACSSPSSVVDLGKEEEKKSAEPVPVKQNRKIRFADEVGQPLVSETLIHREANYASRIVVMLLSPKDRKFEFLHAEYPLDESTTVQVLLEQVPSLATNEAFRTKKFNALLQTETSRQLDNSLALQDYKFKESEIVLGVPDDFTVANMTKMAVPLLLNKKLMKTVKQAIRKGRGLKTVKSGEEWKGSNS